MTAPEIRQMPATLNGFYLHLIRRVLADTSAMNTNRDILYALLGLSIAHAQPFDCGTIFSKLCARFPHLVFSPFEVLFQHLCPLIFKRYSGKFILCHATLADWLTDVKFCTQSYLVSLPEAHFCLALACRAEMALGLCQYKKMKFHLDHSEMVLAARDINYASTLFEPLEEKFAETERSLESGEISGPLIR